MSKWKGLPGLNAPGLKFSDRRVIACLAIAAIVTSTLSQGAARVHALTGPGQLPRAALRGGIVNPLLQEQVRRLLVGTSRNPRRSTQFLPLEISSTRDVAPLVRSLGGTVEADISGRVLSAEVPANQVDQLARESGVTELFASQRMQLYLDRSVPEIRANQAWNLVNRDGVQLRGNHVLVGVVDSGIDYHNPDFKNPDGSTRIKYLWDQTYDGKPPAGYTFGYECDSDSINSGQCPEKDTDGHGTHVSGIAAGNGRSGNPPQEIGVAPQADLIVVKSDLDTDKIIAAWKYLVDKARQLGEPIVINSSFGTLFGPHDGSEPDSQAIDALGGRGVIFVAAAGNAGNQSVHTDGTVASGQSASIEVNAHGAFQNLTFAVFYSAKDAMTATLTNVSTGETFGPVTVKQVINNQTAKDGKTLVTVDATPWDSNYNSIAVSLDTSSTDQNVAGQWRLTLDGSQIVDNGRYDAWLNTGQDGLQAFSTPDESDTIGDPADARTVISVANYATRTTWTDHAYKQHIVCDYTPCIGGVQSLGDIASHSSVGPTSDGRQKPDIAAPGVLIFSSLTHDVPLCDDKTTINCVDPMFVTSDGNNYIASGTSMSSPHVTGVVALMLQADPLLDPSQADAILRATARHDQFTGPGGWTPSFGAGKVDAYAAVQAALAASRATPKPVPTRPAPLPTPQKPVPVHTLVVPRFQILAVRADRTGGTAYANLQRSPLTRVKRGQPVSLSIYTDYRQLPKSASITIGWSVTVAGRRVFGRSTDRTGRNTPIGLAWSHRVFIPRAPGQYVFTGSVTVDSQREQLSTRFRVVT